MDTSGALTARSETTKSPRPGAILRRCDDNCQNRRHCSTVAGRTRLLDRCRTCREADRQATGTVVLLSEVVDRDSSEGSAKRWPRRTSPHTPPCAWARGYFDGLTGPVAEGGTGRRNKTKIPLRGHTREGDQGRVRDVLTTQNRTRKILRTVDQAFRGPESGPQ